MSNKIFYQALKKYHEDVISGSFIPRPAFAPKRHGDFIVVESLITNDPEHGFIHCYDAFYSMQNQELQGLLYYRDSQGVIRPKDGFDCFYGDGLFLDIYLNNAKYEKVCLNHKGVSHVKKRSDIEGFPFPDPSGKFVDGVAVEYELIDVVMQNGDVFILNVSIAYFLDILSA
jgi:hypothetical protein